MAEEVGSSYQEKETKCSVCGSPIGIGRHVNDNETLVVTDPCINPLCAGSGTVTLVGEKK
jgi:hypothetical protein